MDVEMSPSTLFFCCFFFFTWLDVMIKMSLPLFIFFDVSVELYTLDLLCP